MQKTIENLTLNRFNNTPNNHLLWAVVTIFFFLPLGILALIKALKVNKLWTKGFYEEAKQTAVFVKMVTIIGMTVGMVTYLSLAIVLGSIYLLAL